MLKRLALAGLCAGSLLILGASSVGGVVAERIFALVAVSFPVGLIALGVGGRRRSRALSGLLLLLWLGLAGSAMAMLGGSGAGEFRYGLPPGAWWMLLGLGGVPLLLTGLGYAATFDPVPPDDPR